MPVLDWTLSRRRKEAGGSTKVYKVDLISMTEDDSFAETPKRSSHGTLRKVKSLNDLLEKEEGADSDNESIKGDSDQGKQQQKPELEQTEQETTSNNWTNNLSQQSKKPDQMIVSGFSTLSRRAGGGMEVPDINMQAIRVFLRNGTHKTIRTNPDTTCKEILQRVLKKISLDMRIFQYGLYIQYAISDGRIAGENEKIGEVNPNTWDTVTRIYLCRKEEFSFSRSRCASFARDFLEMERQHQRDDSEFAYDVTEFRKIQKHIKVTSSHGKLSTVAVHDGKTINEVTNKYIAECFAEAWAKATAQLDEGKKNVVDPYIETGIHFKVVKPQSHPRKSSYSATTLNRSYTIDRGKQQRPPLSKMMSTGSIDTPLSRHPLTKTVSIAASPLLQGVNANSNNSNNNNNNMPLQLQVESMINLPDSKYKSEVHPFARPLQHCTSLTIINIQSTVEEDATGSLSQSNKSGLLKQISPFSSCSSLDLHNAKRESVRSLSLDKVSSRNLKPIKPHSPLLSSVSMPCLVEAFTNNDHASTSTTTQPISGTRKDLDSKVEKKNIPKTKPIYSRPPPLPPRCMHTPGATTYSSSTLPVKKKAIKKSPTCLDLPKDNNPAKPLKRRRSISVADFQSSLEKTSLKITSLCTPDSLKKAAITKFTASKLPKRNVQQNLVREPSNYNVSVKEMMAIRAAMTTLSRSSTRPNVVVKPSPPTVPQRSSSLASSNTSDEDIILQYKRISRESLFSFKDIETTLDDNSGQTTVQDNPPIYDVAVSNNETLYAIADHKVGQEAGHPQVGSGHVYNVAYPKPNHQHQDPFSYDHLDFSKPPMAASSERSNTRVTPNASQMPQEYEESCHVVEQLTPPVATSPTCSNGTSTKNNYYNIAATQDAKPESNCVKQSGKSSKLSHSGQQVKGFPQAVGTGKRKPSSLHIYEDMDSDYDEIEGDEEDYVVMESKPPAAPTQPPPPPPFVVKLILKTNDQTQVTTTTGSHATKSFSNVAPIPLPPPQLTSFTGGQNVGKTSSGVPVNKSSVTKQPSKQIEQKKTEGINFQEELKNKLQAVKRTGQTSQNHMHNTTVKRPAAPYPVITKDPKLSELETKFQALNSSHSARTEMIEKTESKLATTNSTTTKRIKLHGYTNVSKKFIAIKEEKETQI